jgi:hypothetical protein
VRQEARGAPQPVGNQLTNQPVIFSCPKKKVTAPVLTFALLRHGFGGRLDGDRRTARMTGRAFAHVIPTTVIRTNEEPSLTATPGCQWTAAQRRPAADALGTLTTPTAAVNMATSKIVRGTRRCRWWPIMPIGPS